MVARHDLRHQELRHDEEGARLARHSTASPTPSTTTRPRASSARRLEGWARKVGWETLLNRAGTTFRKLPDKDKDGLDREEGDRADARPAVDDQAAGARRRRQAAGRLQAGARTRRRCGVRRRPARCACRGSRARSDEARTHAATVTFNSTRPKVTTGFSLRPSPFSNRTRPYRSIVRNVLENCFLRGRSRRERIDRFRPPLGNKRQQGAVLLRQHLGEAFDRREPYVGIVGRGGAGLRRCRACSA